MTMTEQPLTCERVDQGNLDRRYLGGQLPEVEASAFEAHFLGCDRCWNLVKGGVGVRAALRTGGALSAGGRRTWWKPLAVAAGIGLVALGTWQTVVLRDPAPRDAVRGIADSLAVQSGATASGWHAAWPADSTVTQYRVRLFAADGRLLLTRELTDTSLEIAATSVPPADRHAPLFLDVQGFDFMRRPVTRSPLHPLRVPGSAP